MLNRLNDDLAGVNTNANLQVRVMQSFHLVLHRQRCEATPDRVILMGLRSAKHSHDSVALGFIDDAVVTANRFIHEIENRLQAPHAQFGIAKTINEAR